MAANEKLEKISVIDELTKLNNRRFFMSELEKKIYNWQRYQEPFSLIYLDADKFKSVNDNYGHDIGDYVLKWISNFLQHNIRKTDIACRLGGDESINSVEDMVKRADSAMYQSKKLGGNQYSIFGE